MTHAKAESTPLSEDVPRRHYSNPPIQEVVIELRVQPLEPVVIEQLKEFRHGRIARFSTEEKVISGGVEVNIDGTGVRPIEVKGDTGLFGFSYRTDDRTELVQVRRNGISYHRLPPYTRWEDVVAESRQLWQRYCQVVHPGTVTQLGLRYINNLALPAPGTLETYLKTYPNISPDLSQLISGYVLQLSMPQPDLVKTVLVQRQALLPAREPGKVSVILDNDLISKEQFDPQSEDVWNCFERMHRRQNQAFEGSITDSLRDIIN